MSSIFNLNRHAILSVTLLALLLSLPHVSSFGITSFSGVSSNSLSPRQQHVISHRAAMHTLGNGHLQSTPLIVLHALQPDQPPAASSRPQSPSQSSKPKKKNKYANFSKTDKISMDPLDAMINESRTKLREMHNENNNKHDSTGNIQKRKSLTKKNRRTSDNIATSLEAVEELLASIDNASNLEGGDEKVEGEELVEFEKRVRNKRYFPDTQTIDPYDPTTYGYIELGTIIGAHGVHGYLKLSSSTDFSEHRLCQPGIRHIKPPNRRSPREVQLTEGRSIRSESAVIGTDSNPIYLIQLEHIQDRESALKLRGCVLYALEEERVDDLLAQDEYIVSDLVGLTVHLNEEEYGDTNADLFVGHIRGVIMGSEMCAIPGLGQDLLEVVLPRRDDRRRGEEMVLVPFVPEIVSSVDLAEGIVFISPPEGLLDLSYVREEKVRIKGLLPPARY